MMKALFLLDPSITYLNHGSFGACPRSVFNEFQQLQRELESEPVQFILKNGPAYLKETKAVLGQYIGCDPLDFFFTPNPTVAINTVMRSISLAPGDEILATDHEYGAMDRTWNFYAGKSGAKYIRQQLPLPIRSKAEMIEAFWSGVTSNTKIIFLNQISSVTALIFPVKEICDRARKHGITTIVDGAHVPGHLALDLRTLDADYYTGSLHKWMLTPKGSSFLYVRKSLQASLDPLVVSWGYESASPGESRFLDYHELQGTRDITAFLATSAAIRFLTDHNWWEVSNRCKKMILEHYPRFCKLLETEPICPITPEFLGQMCSIPVTTNDPVALKNLLFDRYKIEIPVMDLNGKTYLRISLNGYNTADDIDTLYNALSEIKSGTDLLSITYRH